SSSDLASVELYNPQTNSFSPTVGLVARRGAATATLLPNGLVLVAGGVNSSGYLASAELFNPVQAGTSWGAARRLATSPEDATAQRPRPRRRRLQRHHCPGECGTL